MFKDRLDYIRQIFSGETALQKNIRTTITDNISIYPEEGRFLQTLIHLGQIKNIIEIGTFAGYSTLWMADALPQDGHLWTIERDPDRAANAKENLKDAQNVTLINDDALNALTALSSHAPFDMVFIDADKLNYARYLDWAEQHVKKGGLIIGDNTFLFDAVWKDGEIERVRETARRAMCDFNQRLSNPEKYASIMLNTPEGMTVAVKLS